MFTKQHYKILAELISESETLEDFIPKLIVALKIDNYNFSESKFVEASKKKSWLGEK